MADTKETDQTRTRYERIAPFYDRMEVLPERRYRSWRSRLWSSIEGPKVLEVGVGTGKNMPYYPDNVDLTAIDLTPGMLERARQQAISLNIEVDLQLGDVQALAFPDNTFDEAVATFVFCSVPDPRLGLSELKRVVKRGGRLFLLEHMRADNAAAGVIMDFLNPLMVRMTGANINRRTVENVCQSGWQLQQVEPVGMKGVFKIIVATNEK